MKSLIKLFAAQPLMHFQSTPLGKSSTEGSPKDIEFEYTEGGSGRYGDALPKLNQYFQCLHGSQLFLLDCP